jgi:hypothetical protein
MTPLGATSEIRFGIAIRPFVMSAKDQTVGNDGTEPSAWHTGFLVCVAAETIGALPRPDSFENRPLATP